nr:hypothetical protein BaRGS_027524 [Batillaria attramentaria]
MTESAKDYRITLSGLHTAIFDPNAIAIVGIGCRTPGADNIREFWKLLSNGECHVGGVPHDRWNSKTYYDPDPMAPGKAPEGFDSALYGINDFEASHMSPQQKFLLDCTNMALEDAGITKSQISGTNTGVFVGSMNNDHLATFLGHNNKVATHTVTGTSATILSARLSYVFNLLGPSMALHDGDKIWATVCTGTNQDGHTVSPMTAPSGEQQKKLLHAVYGKFGVDVTSLDYIEAHGTGTPAGDPVEANALGEFFNQAGEPHDRHIGSVKTNIGHTESAAGVLGLIKVLLMMEHDTISLTGSLEDLYTDKEAPLLNVHDVSYTSTVRRDHYYYRAAFVVKDMQDLLTDVRDKLTIDDLASPAPGEFDTVFVFCGMGTAWQGMCAELLAENSVFRNAMMEVDKELSAYVKWSLLDRLEKKEDPAQDGVFGPIAIFACQVALTAVWRSLGIQPACVLGQSIGEVAAAYTGGCLGLADAVKIIYHRTIFLAEATGGSMIVVKNVNIGKVQQVLSETGIRASVALEYSPTACAISSSSDVMPDLRRQLLTRLKDDFRDMQLIDLSVTVAYHSPHVDSCAGKLAGVLKGLEASPPKLPLISAVTGTAMTTPPGVSYWVDNISKPVLFRQAMADSLSAGKSSRTVFLEIGPKPVLTAHMKDLFPTEDCTSIPSMLRQSEMKSLLQGMVALYELGADISWKDLPTYGGQMTDVPRYIFDKRYVAESPEMHVVLKSGCNIYSKNHLFMCPSRESAMSFSLMISPLCAPSIFDHVLSDRIIVPGALYAEAGFAVARYSHIAHQVAVSVEFQHPMPLKRDEATELEAHFETKDDTTEVWRCPLVVQKDGRRLAVIRLAEFKSVVRETVNIDLIRSRCKDKLNKDEAYNLLKKFGFEYGEAFALLETVHRSSSESLGLVKLNDIVRGEMPGTTIHPCIIDCMLQSPPFLMVGGRSASLDILPKSVGQLVVHRPMEQTMFVHARLKDYSDNTVVYTHRLLSAAGHVIAEMEDHTVQILSPQAGGFASSTLTMEWQKIVDMEDATPEIMTENGKRELLIISDVDLEEVNGHAIVRYDSKKEESLLDKAGLISILERNKDVKAIVVVFTESPHEEMDGEAAQLPVLNTCCMIQTILTTLHDMSYKLPFYFCANSAWPKEDGKGDELKVNPAATAMCGLFRAVFQERVYLYVTFIDLHMDYQAGDLSKLVLLWAIQSKVETDHVTILVSSATSHLAELLQVIWGSGNDSSDMTRLLDFESVSLSDLQVTVVTDKLFRRDSAYIVVGGLTGLGWICVKFLAENEAGYIAIFNRRQPSETKTAEIENLSKTYGCSIEVFQVDISAIESLKEVMKRFSDASFRFHLKGVFIGAAVVDDGPFDAMEREAFHKVLQPKVKGTWNLHQVTKEIPLDYFVMHSSVSSVLGNLGQANYSCANAFLDGLAYYRRQLGLSAQTINWGPLDTGILDNQDEIKQRLQSMGFHMASEFEITETLWAVLRLKMTQSVPVRLNGEVYGRLLYAAFEEVELRRFHKIISPPQTVSSKASAKRGDMSKVKFLEPSKRLKVYESYLRELTSRLVTVDESRISSTVTLINLGLDSVTSMMMINQIHRDTTIKLAAVDVLAGEVTVASVAKMLTDAAEGSGRA